MFQGNKWCNKKDLILSLQIFLTLIWQVFMSILWYIIVLLICMYVLYFTINYQIALFVSLIWDKSFGKKFHSIYFHCIKYYFVFYGNRPKMITRLTKNDFYNPHSFLQKKLPLTHTCFAVINHDKMIYFHEKTLR